MTWHRRLLNLLRSERTNREIDRELSFHVAELADELMTAGHTEADAWREARRRFGNYGLQKERTRDIDVLPWLESIVADLRYALRALRGSPALSLVAILSLGLGIGANTAIFSLINAVMLRPLPVSKPAELLQVTLGENRVVVTNPIWEQVRDRQDVFGQVLATGNATFDLSRAGEARRIHGSWVSGDYFHTLGVTAALGRTLQPSDDVRGCPAIAVLGHGFWRSEFGASPAVIGRTISLSGFPFQVVGVSRAGFTGMAVGRDVSVYTPLCALEVSRGSRAQLDAHGTYWLRIFGRPRPGVTRAELQARLAALAPSVFQATASSYLSAENRRSYLAMTLQATPAAGGVSYVEHYNGALLVLMGIVAVVLLIACANVANLLLARATARAGEIAVRLAIGASRARLVRQLLTESLLLSVLSALAGITFAAWSSRLLVRFLSTRFDEVSIDVSIDGTVLFFTLLLATVTGLLFGLAPAWRARHIDPQSALKGSARGLVRGHSRFRAGQMLVVAQVALSLVLLTASGLLMSTFWRLATMDPGFRHEQIMVVSADLQRAAVPAAQRAALLDRLLERMRALPGVNTASAADMTPIGGGYAAYYLLVDGFKPAAPDDDTSLFNTVSDGYFATLGMKLLAGRDFTPGDVAGSGRVVIVNEALARRFFGSTAVLGKQFRMRLGDSASAPLRIVGLVSDAKFVSLRENSQPTAYVPLAQRTGYASPNRTFLLNVRGPAALPARSVKQAVQQIDDDVILDFNTLTRQLSDSLIQERLLAVLSGFFGAVALLLAMIGLYGIMSYSVARRRREIGIRMAFGAARPAVLKMVLSQVGGMVAAGIALGLSAALSTTRLVAGFLYGVEPTDPLVFALAVLLLAAVALAAGYLPARRAARLEPMMALREE